MLGINNPPVQSPMTQAPAQAQEAQPGLLARLQAGLRSLFERLAALFSGARAEAAVPRGGQAQQQAVNIPARGLAARQVQIASPEQRARGEVKALKRQLDELITRATKLAPNDPQRANLARDLSSHAVLSSFADSIKTVWAGQRAGTLSPRDMADLHKQLTKLNEKLGGHPAVQSLVCLTDPQVATCLPDNVTVGGNPPRLMVHGNRVFDAAQKEALHRQIEDRLQADRKSNEREDGLPICQQLALDLPRASYRIAGSDGQVRQLERTAPLEDVARDLVALCGGDQEVAFGLSRLFNQIPIVEFDKAHQATIRTLTGHSFVALGRGEGLSFEARRSGDDYEVVLRSPRQWNVAVNSDTQQMQAFEQATEGEQVIVLRASSQDLREGRFTIVDARATLWLEP